MSLLYQDMQTFSEKKCEEICYFENDEKKKKIVSLKFNGNEKAIQWEKRTLDCVDGNAKKKKKDIKKKVKKSVISYLCFVSSGLFVIGRNNFQEDNSNRTGTFRPLMRGVHYFFLLFRGFL